MDQGQAAIAAGGMAAFAALVGSFVGARVGRRTVRDQAQVEHGQWLRNKRQEAYVSVLAAWDGAIQAFEAVLEGAEDRIARYRWEVENSDGGVMFFDAALFDEVKEISAPVVEALERVRLLGPDAVERAAMNLEDALLGIGGAVRAGATAEADQWPNRAAWSEARRNAGECRQEFFNLSRDVLRTAPDTDRGTAR
ncbi:hypothetical protein ACWEP8_37015 [Streptomyces hydrogenans]